MSHHTSASHGDNLTLDDAENRLRLIEEHEITDPYLFASSTIINATFPHSSRAGKEQVLVNGGLTVTMYSRKGLPYGHYPRLIMLWLGREIVRRNADPQLTTEEARRIPLGASLHEFLQEVGIIRGKYNSEKGDKKRASGNSYQALRNQLERLFATTISTDWKVTEHGSTRVNWDNVQISDKGFLWWDESFSEQAILEGAYVLVSEKFFRDTVKHAVPFDALHVAGFSRRSMALDAYGWANLRLATHSGSTRVTWEQLKGQIGTSYPDTAQGVRNFRKKFRIALEEIKRVWPEAAIYEWANGILLHGDKPAVPKKAKDDYLKQLAANESPF